MPWRSCAVRAGCAAVALACSSASAQVFRCPSAAGLTYQQGPCAGLGAGGGRLLLLDNGQAAPRPTPLGRVPRAEPVVVRTRLTAPTAPPVPAGR